MSDFALLDNRYGQMASLFPDFAEQGEIRFVEFLAQLARLRPVRIITTSTPSSRGLVSHSRLRPARGVEVRFAPAEYHEKGILAPGFYLEGSMNITYSGVYVRDEKVTLHAATDPEGARKVARAYLEFNRRWENLAASGEGRA